MFKNLDKTSIAGIATCIAIMILLFMRMSDRNAQLQQQQAEESAKVQASETSSPAVSSSASAPAVAAAQGTPASPAPASPAPASAPSASAAPASAAVEAARSGQVDPLLPVGPSARQASSESPFAIASEGEGRFLIDPRSGVVGVELSEYSKQRVKGEECSPVVLGKYDYPFLALSSQEGALKWQAVKQGSVVLSEDGKEVRSTRLSADGNLEITECWSVVGGGRYEVDYKVTFRNLGANAIEVSNLALELGALSPMMAGAGEVGYGGVAYMPVSDDHCKLYTAGDLTKAAKAHQIMVDPNATSAQRQEASEDRAYVKAVSWACVHTRYFMQGVKSNDSGFSFEALDAFALAEDTGTKSDKTDVRYRGRLMLPRAVLASGEVKTLSFTGFVGPMELELLRDKKIGLEGILGIDRFFWGNPDWMGSLSRFFVKSLKWISGFFSGSWGLGFALVLLTLIVKLIFWPLSYKASRSMKKMQELQPQLKALREKYKSDPQEMYRRQQELFKSNHVSQLGGCLPMLVQIPIFFALFNTFRGAIELRQASFLWATDLSLPDTVLDLGFIGLNPMALIMVGTMLWQQSITPSGDPHQKRMMMMMSVVFVFFLYTQPSGLTLYMTVNQLLSMLQFWILRKLDGRKGAPAAVAAGVASK